MCFSSKNSIITYWTQPTFMIFMGWGKSRNPCKRLRLGANGQSDCVYWADVLRGYSISLWYKQQEQQQWQAEKLRPVDVVGCWPFFQLPPLKNGRPPHMNTAHLWDTGWRRHQICIDHTWWIVDLCYHHPPLKMYFRGGEVRSKKYIYRSPRIWFPRTPPKYIIWPVGVR